MATIPEEPSMSWSLRLVERVGETNGLSGDICEIAAPTELAMLGLTTVKAKAFRS
jgi:hypothetical protein